MSNLFGTTVFVHIVTITTGKSEEFVRREYPTDFTPVIPRVGETVTTSLFSPNKASRSFRVKKVTHKWDVNSHEIEILVK